MRTGAVLQWAFTKTPIPRRLPVRTTSLLRLLIGVTDLIVDTFSLETRGLVLDVRPRWRRPRCGGCGRLGPGYDCSGPRLWRHLGIGDLKIWLRYAPGG